MPRSTRKRQNKVEIQNSPILTEPISQMDEEVRKMMLKHTQLEQKSRTLEKELAATKEKIVGNLVDLRRAVDKMTTQISNLEAQFGVTSQSALQVSTVPTLSQILESLPRPRTSRPRLAC
ncbi:hypothetical protein BC832DRAFT_594331 [Gaertneriomyces semiglobifer]|nr:hypothetical protein BC832DRAFT_594331 [Gaertneriomyces semiglobifer]